MFVEGLLLFRFERCLAECSSLSLLRVACGLGKEFPRCGEEGTYGERRARGRVMSFSAPHRQVFNYHPMSLFKSP